MKKREWKIEFKDAINAIKSGVERAFDDFMSMIVEVELFVHYFNTRMSFGRQSSR